MKIMIWEFLFFCCLVLSFSVKLKIVAPFACLMVQKRISFFFPVQFNEILFNRNESTFSFILWSTLIKWFTNIKPYNVQHTLTHFNISFSITFFCVKSQHVIVKFIKIERTYVFLYTLSYNKKPVCVRKNNKLWKICSSRACNTVENWFPIQAKFELIWKFFISFSQWRYKFNLFFCWHLGIQFSFEGLNSHTHARK